MSSPALTTVYRYHDGTKHAFNRFARSLGYLDWASQPRPFRAYVESPVVELERRRRRPSAAPADGVAARYDDLFVPGRTPAAPLSLPAVGDMLRHALGLSAWKVLGSSRWALRANPSSGNLHPTEAYVIIGPLAGLSAEAGVWHYAPDRHALEQRCRFPADRWPLTGDDGPAFLVALTSIHWREAWKYGERAFRYCQHDLGHAIAALAMAAAASGWTMTVERGCAHRTIGRLTGIDRDEDFVDAEREEAGCLMLVGAPRHPRLDAGGLAETAGRGRWSGRASQLSEDHVQWSFIDEIAAATRDPGLTTGAAATDGREQKPEAFSVSDRARPATCRGPACHGARCGGRRAFTLRSSSTGWLASSRASMR
jgi:SagB-type dehydrogenase family enzyme